MLPCGAVAACRIQASFRRHLAQRIAYQIRETNRLRGLSHIKGCSASGEPSIGVRPLLDSVKSRADTRTGFAVLRWLLAFTAVLLVVSVQRFWQALLRGTHTMLFQETAQGPRRAIYETESVVLKALVYNSSEHTTCT